MTNAVAAIHANMTASAAQPCHHSNVPADQNNAAPQELVANRRSDDRLGRDDHLPDAA